MLCERKMKRCAHLKVNMKENVRETERKRDKEEAHSVLVIEDLLVHENAFSPMIQRPLLSLSLIKRIR